MTVDAIGPNCAYRPPVCPFPAPHGQLEMTDLPHPSGFQYVCGPHLDAAIATVAPPTPVGWQTQPRCSGCDAGQPLEGADPFEIAVASPSRTFYGAEPYVRACTAHAIASLSAVLETS